MLLLSLQRGRPFGKRRELCVCVNLIIESFSGPVPLGFNLPRYQDVPFPGMCGVETPRCWVDIYQRKVGCQRMIGEMFVENERLCRC